jgi:hypothetical protein
VLPSITPDHISGGSNGWGDLPRGNFSENSLIDPIGGLMVSQNPRKRMVNPEENWGLPLPYATNCTGFVCEVTARAGGDPQDEWGIYLSSGAAPVRAPGNASAIAVLADGSGHVAIDSPSWDLHAGGRAGIPMTRTFDTLQDRRKSSRLLVRFDHGLLDVWVNDALAFSQIPIDPVVAPASVGLTGWCSSTTGSVEFSQVRWWTLESHANLAAVATPATRPADALLFKQISTPGSRFDQIRSNPVVVDEDLSSGSPQWLKNASNPDAEIFQDGRHCILRGSDNGRAVVPLNWGPNLGNFAIEVRAKTTRSDSRWGFALRKAFDATTPPSAGTAICLQSSGTGAIPPAAASLCIERNWFDSRPTSRVREIESASQVPVNESNDLMLVLIDKKLEVFVNGRQVVKELDMDDSQLPASMGLFCDSSRYIPRMEIENIRVWSLPAAATQPVAQAAATTTIPVRAPDTTGILPVFEDNFAQTRLWGIGGDGHYLASYANGAYDIQVGPGRQYWWTGAPGTREDFICEMQGICKGNHPGAYWGLTLTAADKSHLAIMLGSDGRVKAMSLSDDTHRTDPLRQILPNTVVNDLLKPAGEINTLTVRMKGTACEVFVNGSRVLDSFSILPFLTPSELGLAVEGGALGGEVELHSYRVWLLKDHPELAK